MKITGNGVRKGLFLLIPIISGSAIAVTPAYAANIAISNIFLELNDFNQKAAGVASLSDISIINIAEEGFVASNIQGDAIFSSNDDRVIARAAFENVTSGSGSRYIGRANISSSLIGSFFVGADRDFKFDFKTRLALSNSVDSLQPSPVSSAGIISLYLFDNSTQKIVPIFKLSSLLNTGVAGEPDVFNVRVGSNIIPTDRFEQISLGESSESVLALLEGSFQWRSSQDTLLTLVAATQSCSYTSNVGQTCLRVPEPSLRLSTLLWLTYILLIAKIVQQVVQLTCQPFFKKGLKDFLENFWR